MVWVFLFMWFVRSVPLAAALQGRTSNLRRGLHAVMGRALPVNRMGAARNQRLPNHGQRDIAGYENTEKAHGQSHATKIRTGFVIVSVNS